ncbi:hypothetical protein KP509_23G050200 [Ceratopteris richardii]|uniref:Uncharacterized protein n=1 Tax=Ceratopteris richardii TaxID=49495 RepID=A0A8T2RZL6_CERRI|nr:hypothetical protein KP509_23G050200 [Ceratopteris richardii]
MDASPRPDESKKKRQTRTRTKNPEVIEANEHDFKELVMEKTSPPAANHPTERRTNRIEGTGNTPNPHTRGNIAAEDSAKLQHLEKLLQSDSDNVGSPGEKSEMYNKFVRSFHEDLS